MQKRTPKEIESDLVDVAKMYVAGWSLRQMADAAGRSFKTMHRDVQRVREAWIEQYTGTYHEHVAAQLAKIDNLEREAWTAWENDRTSDGVSVDMSEGGELSHIPGNLRHDASLLGNVRWCIEARLKILGAFGPHAKAPEFIDVGITDKHEAERSIFENQEASFAATQYLVAIEKAQEREAESEPEPVEEGDDEIARTD